jgi:hypothetical protein
MTPDKAEVILAFLDELVSSAIETAFDLADEQPPILVEDEDVADDLRRVIDYLLGRIAGQDHHPDPSQD